MPALPTICIAAGVGVVWAARAALAYRRDPCGAAPRACARAIAAVAGLVVLAAAVETVDRAALRAHLVQRARRRRARVAPTTA